MKTLESSPFLFFSFCRLSLKPQETFFDNKTLFYILVLMSVLPHCCEKKHFLLKKSSLSISVPNTQSAVITQYCLNLWFFNFMASMDTDRNELIDPHMKRLLLLVASHHCVTDRVIVKINFCLIGYLTCCACLWCHTIIPYIQTSL